VRTGRFVYKAVCLGWLFSGCAGGGVEPIDSPIGNAGGFPTAGMTGAFAGTGGAPMPMAGSSGIAGMAPTITAGTDGAAGMDGVAGMDGAAGMDGMAGMDGAAGMDGMAGMDGAAGMDGMAGTDGAAGMDGMAGMSGTAGTGAGTGTCCPSGDCLCHGPAPTRLTSSNGSYRTQSYTVARAGCVYYPTDAEPPFAAVAISDGFLGTGGCGVAQTGRWGPLLASHGIVTMIVNTGSGDQPAARGRALTAGIAAFKAENTRSGGPLLGKLSGRYGTAGFSMGGGGTTYASAADATLRSSIPIMPWGPTRGGSVTVPTLVICGSSDTIASCSSHGTPYYGQLANTVPKMRKTVSGGHNGQPSAGGGVSGEFGLAFHKLFLEGDERWRPLLVRAMSDASTIR
jgi:hypothetical protein